MCGITVRFTLIASSIDPLRLDLRSRLHRLAHLRRKRRRAHLLALRASFALRPVFGHYHMYRRQIKDLPAFAILGWHVSQTALTVWATLDRMHLNILRVGSQHQRVALVPGAGRRLTYHSSGADCAAPVSCTRHWTVVCHCCCCSWPTGFPAPRAAPSALGSFAVAAGRCRPNFLPAQSSRRRQRLHLERVRYGSLRDQAGVAVSCPILTDLYDFDNRNSAGFSA